MRYYYGFGVGHTYFWSEGDGPQERGSPHDKGMGEDELEEDAQGDVPEEHNDSRSVNSMDCGSDLTDEDSNSVPDATVNDESDDEEFHARYEMYHHRS